MSSSVTALGGQSFEGRVRVEDAGLLGMITLRLEATDTATKALHDGGFKRPEQGAVMGGLSGGALWMSPDEVLLLCDYDAVGETIARLNDHFDGQHFLAADVSDARCVIKLTGEARAVRETLARLTPADLRAQAVPPGTLRRTRLAQVPAAIWFENEETAVIVAFRSVADYVFGLLTNAAKGDAVGHF
ncbi:MAG: sarcosine oxidase subunit gamma [Silicimonas sp.]|nr:sarcosine oxidase subunit gamma [Silicimonas sp.]